jgi:tetratricopeptide (TPR) repeat protein
LIPSAFAAEFFCPAKAGGYIIDPDDEHRIANGSFFDTVYCDYGVMKDFWYGRDFESVGSVTASYQHTGPYDYPYHTVDCGETKKQSAKVWFVGSEKTSVTVRTSNESVRNAGYEILSLLEQSGLAIDCPGYTPPSDSDNDGVSDDVDVCPNGDDTIDSDGDGTPDACDLTPYGVSSSTDPDNDKVFGSEDRCPMEVGPKENGGCPWEVQDAENYVNNRDYKKVAEITDEILKTKPREMRAVWLGGIAHYNLEDYDTSVNRFRTYTEIVPQDYTGYEELGKSFIALENYNDAINILGIGITLAPPDKQPPINDLIHYAKIDYFYQQGGNNVCHPEKSNWSFTDTKKTTRTKNASDQIFSLTSQNHNFDREIKDVMFVKVINGNNPSVELLVAWTETGVDTGKFFPDIETYDELFTITPDTIHFEFGNECTDVLKFTIFIIDESTLDSDDDGILNENDLCRDDPEIYNEFEDDDGCPDVSPVDQCFLDYLSNFTGDEPPSEINDILQKTITCVIDTQNNPKNPDTTIHLMGLYAYLAYNFEELGEEYSEQESNSWRQVITYATKILNSDSNSDEAYFALAISYFELGEFQNAFLAIDNAIIINPNDSGYLDFKNEILQYQEDTKSSSYSITKNEGEVTIILEYTRNTNISGKETLFAGHSIETTTGKIDFSNEKAKFTLDENTSIKITSSDNLKKIIDLKKGKLYASFDKSLCDGIICNIITPTSVQQITGTEFVINYDVRSKKTTVFLNEGTMDIFPNDGISQSITGPKAIRIVNTEIAQISDMSKNMWSGEIEFREFEQKQDESTKDFDQWMYFEDLIDCENEEDCDASNASIRFFIPQGWVFDSIIDFDYSYSDYGDHGDYDGYDSDGYDSDGYDSDGYDYPISPSSFDIFIPQTIFENLFNDFFAYGDETDDDENDDHVDDNHGDYDNDNHGDYDDDGCEEGCSGIIVDKWNNSHLSGERFHEDTSMLWIGDWAFGEDEFILLLLEKNNSFKLYDESQYYDYIQNLSEYFCQDDDPIYGEECNIQRNEDAKLLHLDDVTAFHQKYFVGFHDDHDDINQVYRFTVIPNGNEIWTFMFATETETDWAYVEDYETVENSLIFGKYVKPKISTTPTPGTPTPGTPTPGTPTPGTPTPGTPTPGTPTPGTPKLPTMAKQKQTPIDIVKKITSNSGSGTSFASKYLDKTESVSKKKVPAWVKNNAKWWSEKQIDDDAFVGGIQYLVKEKIITVPQDLVTKSKFIKFNAKEFTKPLSRGETVTVEINGKIENFARDAINLEIQYPDNKITKQTLVGANGEYQTLLLLDNQSPIGTYNVKVKYLNKIVDIGKFTLKSKTQNTETIIENKPMPDWLRNNAKWWSQGQISEDDFIQGIEYLIQNGILTFSADEVKTVEEKSEIKEQTKTFNYNTKSLKIDKSSYKIPTSRGASTVVSITGEIDDYLSGVAIYIELETPDGEKIEQKVRAASGFYNTQIMIDPSYVPGQYIIKIMYLDKIVDAISFDVTN